MSQSQCEPDGRGGSAGGNSAVARRRLLALSLTWVAGFVDAVGYLTLYRVFTANMSGNSVAMGLHAAGGQWRRAAHRGFPILMFVAGLVLCGAVHELARRRKLRRALAVTLAMESLLLLAFMVLGAYFGQRRGVAGDAPPWTAALPVAAAALAMGLQNASLTRVGALSIHTTHVTGELTRLGEEAVAYLFWLGEHWADSAGGAAAGRVWRAARESCRREELQNIVTQSLLWAFYVAGAAWGGVMLGRWGFGCVALPIGVLLAAVAGMWRGM